MLKKIGNWVRKLFTGKPRDIIKKEESTSKALGYYTPTSTPKKIEPVQEIKITEYEPEKETKEDFDKIEEGRKLYVSKEYKTFSKFFEFYCLRDNKDDIIPLEKIFEHTHLTFVSDYIKNTQNIIPGRHRTVIIDDEAQVNYEKYCKQFLPLSYDQRCYLAKAFINTNGCTASHVARKYISYNIGGINHINIDIKYLGTQLTARYLEVEMVKTLQYQTRGRKYFSRHCWFSEGQANLIIAKALDLEAPCKNHNISKKDLCTEGVFRKAIDKYGYQKVVEQCVYYTKNVENWQIIDYKSNK